MAVVDATECMPTFGAGTEQQLWLLFSAELAVPSPSAFDDIRGFVRGGYSTLMNREGDLARLVSKCHEVLHSL